MKFSAKIGREKPAKELLRRAGTRRGVLGERKSYANQKYAYFTEAGTFVQLDRAGRPVRGPGECGRRVGVYVGG